MAQYLVALSARSIQPYVFASNRLVDIIGASALVDDLFAADALRRDFGELNTTVLTSQGGAAMLLVQSDEAPSRGVARFSRRRLIEAPGLEVDVTVLPHAVGHLAAEVAELAAAQARTSLDPVVSASQGGGAGLASCLATGGVASTVDIHTGTPLSAQAAAARLRGRTEADRSGTPLPAPLESWHAVEPTELDKLGRTMGERSLIGVVHLDGNGIGGKIKRWCDGSHGLDDGDAISAIQGWSESLRACAEAAWEEVRRLTDAAVTSSEQGHGPEQFELRGPIEDLWFPLSAEVDHARGRKRVFVPVRQVLIGGDDITFVCDGRIALALGVAAARAFAANEAGALGPVTASVGIALVHAHSPFIRACALATELCDNAKVRFGDRPAIDWHLGLVHPGESLADARRAVTATNFRPALTCRPYPLEDEAPGRSWTDFDQTLLDFAPHGPGLRNRSWSAAGTKRHALAEVARQGPQAVTAQLKTWSIVDSGLRLPPPLDSNGFMSVDGAFASPLLDALELVDRHQPLGRSPSGPGGDAASSGIEPVGVTA